MSESANWLIEIYDLPPDSLACSHPDLKNPSWLKIGSYCKLVRCPFLVPIDATDGRTNPNEEMATRRTRPDRQYWPGE